MDEKLSELELANIIIGLKKERDALKEQLKTRITEVEADILRKENRRLVHQYRVAEVRLAKTRENINTAYDNQVKVVKLACNNIAGEILQSEKLQDVVIYHLGLMKKELEETLK